jgi:hypothetical protein
MMAGCSQSNAPAGSGQSAATATTPAAPPALVTGKTAFWPIYKAALAWSSDAQIMRLSQKEVPGFKNQAGKAAMWECAVGSPSLHQFRLYTYSIADELPEIHKGTTAGPPRSWSGPTRDAMPIDVSFFNTDSDAAYQVSATDAAAWLAKNPDKPLTSLELGNTAALNAPVWYIAWGNKKSGGYVGLVNAVSGIPYKGK